MPVNPNQWYNTLSQKLRPSFDIQRRGSVNLPIKSSSTFGPQINTGTFTRFQHDQNPTLAKMFNRMNQ